MQKKLVIDIFPPEKVKQSEQIKQKQREFSALEEEKGSEEEVEEFVFFEKKKKNYFKYILIGFFLLLLSTFFVLHLFFAEVKIALWPRVKNLDLEEEILIDSKAKSVDYANKIIPGQIFEIEKVVTEDFPASGTTLKKAEGVIRLYNAYSTESELWREGTRFVSSEGKLFLSKDKIRVPGAELKNGKIVPSFVDVPVIAAEGGEEYNIGPSKFSVFVFRGTERYTKFYGESTEPMKGGGKGFQVTKEDIEKAEKAMEEKVKSQVIDILKKEIPKGYTILNGAVETSILEKKSLSNVGTIADKFQFQIKFKAKTILFKESDAQEFSKLVISNQLSSKNKIYQESLKQDYKINWLDLKEEKAKMTFLVSFKSSSEINEDSLKRILAGKSLVEVKKILSEQTEIDKSEVKLFPFWLNKIPTNLNKIKIEKKD